MIEYVEERKDSCNALLKTLVEIPSWTGGEIERSRFCKKYLEELGYENVSIDTANNVICEYNIKEGKENVVFAAHLDTVFSEDTDYTIKEIDGKLYAPGIGDNSVNAVSLLLLARYVKEMNLVPECGIYFVFTTGEEGLGNLVGARTFTENYKERIKSFIAIDLYMDKIFDTCVGSIRYEVNVKTSGGHSYLDFGKKNAIAVLSELVAKCYSGIFNREYLTYNVGNIKGGTTVNTIAANATMLFEFRSMKNAVMNKADSDFKELVNSLNNSDVELTCNILGKRPCGEAVSKLEMDRLVDLSREAITESGMKEPIVTNASTDCNIPLSLSIPAICFGTATGFGAHTLNEYIEKDSNIIGIEVLIRFFNKYVMGEI